MDKLWLVLSVVLVLPCLCKTEGNFEDYYYKTLVKITKCEQRSYQTCSGWWFWRSCTTHYYQYCWDVYETQEMKGRKCQTGWRDYPGNCDIPICTKACTGGQVCTAPNTCTCLTTGGLCSSVPCTPDINCYPGSCANQQQRICSCPAGFSGANCIEFNRVPDINECSAVLYAGSPEKVVGTAPCAPAGLDPQTIWTNSLSPTRLQVKWNLQYNDQISVPDSSTAPHVTNAPVVLGIKSSSFTTSLNPKATPCSITLGANNNLPPSAPCDVGSFWSDTGLPSAKHLLVLTTTVQGLLGGSKRGSDFSEQSFVTKPATRQASFKFDLVPPQHCLSNLNNIEPTNVCDVFAIYLPNDISTNQLFQPRFYNWTDVDSGISMYHIEVYLMKAGVGDLLYNNGPPVFVDDIDPSQNSAQFALTTAGVYAIELSVMDVAGNVAKARKIIIYDNLSKITQDPSKPIAIKEADASSGGSWITSFTNDVTVQWAGHFTSNAHYGDGWSNTVSPWRDGIDDRFGEKYGLRSIKEITNNIAGIVAYNLAYVVDDQGGRGLTYTNRTWTSVNGTTTSFILPITPPQDGQTIVIWMNANDMSGSGNNLIEQLTVSVDRSRPVVESGSFKHKSVDEYTSSVYIQTYDNSSGIQRISFVIYSTTLKIPVYNGTAKVITRDAPDQSSIRSKRDIIQPCYPYDTTCYCTGPLRQCFNITQEIQIDHCWIDRLAGDSFEVRFQITNYAFLVSTEQSVNLGILTDIPCRSSGLAPGAIAAIVIGILIGLLILIVLVYIAVTMVRVRVYHKAVPKRLHTIRNFIGGDHTKDNPLYVDAGDLTPTRPVQNDYSRKNDGASFPPPYSELHKNELVTGAANEQEDDVYVYGRIPQNKIKYGKKIGEGHFADILLVLMINGNTSHQVVAKMLKRGYGKENADLMKAKINYFKNDIPPHTNVIRYVGNVTDDVEAGPVLLLEHCDKTMTDWLKGVHTVDPDVLESMLTFILGIARGMEHLHANRIIHKRLAVRNVLLNTERFGYVPKLIGFGPSTSDSDMGRKVPTKWLALETLESLETGPAYNQNTDVWSYAILVCEIYSKGAAPYLNMKSENITSYLKSGQRMQRPEHLPKELFDSVVTPSWAVHPTSRPSFTRICQLIEKFRSDSGTTQDGYYAPNPNTSGERDPNVYDDAR